MKAGGVGKCRSTGHRCLELHSERAFKDRFRQSHIYAVPVTRPQDFRIVEFWSILKLFDLLRVVGLGSP